MRIRLIMALGLSSVLTIGSSAQPPAAPAIGDPRVAIPGDLKAPSNKLGTELRSRSLVDSTTSRFVAPPAVKSGDQPATNQLVERSFEPVRFDSNRWLNAPVTQKETSVLRREAGDKVNKFPEAVLNRHLTSTDESLRVTAPALQVTSHERNGLGR